MVSGNQSLRLGVKAPMSEQFLCALHCSHSWEGCFQLTAARHGLLRQHFVMGGWDAMGRELQHAAAVWKESVRLPRAPSPGHRAEHTVHEMPKAIVQLHGASIDLKARGPCSSEEVASCAKC